MIRRKTPLFSRFQKWLCLCLTEFFIHLWKHREDRGRAHQIMCLTEFSEFFIEVRNIWVMFLQSIFLQNCFLGLTLLKLKLFNDRKKREKSLNRSHSFTYQFLQGPDQLQMKEELKSKGRNTFCPCRDQFLCEPSKLQMPIVTLGWYLPCTEEMKISVKWFGPSAEFNQQCIKHLYMQACLTLITNT